MRFLRRTSLRRSFWRRLCAGLTLVAYLLTAFGVPLPAGATSTSACAATACGCASDEQCRSGSCCCSTDGKSTNAPAPAPGKKPTAASCTGKRGCAMPCCRHGAPSGSCPHDQPVPTPTDGDEPVPISDDELPTGGVRWVLGIAAMKCRGHSTLWVSAGVVLPPTLTLVVRPLLHPIGWIAGAEEVPVLADHIPPLPPPRLLQA
jgi:hypothetical protein